jgi:hypothetical protein
VLDDVVAVLVVKKLSVALPDLVQDFFLRFLAAVFKNALKDPTAVRMARQRHGVDENIGDDEAYLLVKVISLLIRSHATFLFSALAYDLYTFLYDVVAILVVDATEDVMVKLDQQPRDVVVVERLESLLNDPTTVHLKRELEHLAFQRVSNFGLDLRRPKVKKFLDDVVAEHVVSEASNRGQDFLGDDQLLSNVPHFESLLDEARAVLVLAKLDNVSGDLVDRPVSVLHGPEFL